MLLLFISLNVSARGFGQEKISLSLKKTEIGGVLRSIEKQTNYRFLYNDKLVDIREKVSLNVVDAELGEVLDLVLHNTRLLYQVMDNNLIVIKENPAAPAADVVIRGTVTGEAGVALSGASVQVKGTTTGTTTDASGNFTLNVADANVTLVISSIGYNQQELPLAGKTEVTVTLVTSTQVMDQVVVVGYGSQRKLDVTGSVGQVSGAEISKQSSINPISSLQGKVAGVQITNSGAPGASPQIRIRGTGTVSGSSDPLYVIDGVWFNDASFVNPSDIESVSILKDASSQAIYGVRAANGVVLITTKKGRSGPPVINYNGYVGMQRVTDKVQMANANQYATLLNEKLALTGTAPAFDASTFGKGTDWYDVILRNALITNHQISVSGGRDKSTFSFSLGYLKQEGIAKKNVYDRVTANLKQDLQVFNNLRIGYTVVSAVSKSTDIPDGSLFYQAFVAPPVVPVRYDDGSYGDPSDYPVGAFANPQASLDFFNQQSQNYRFTGNVYAELKFLRNFTYRVSAGGEMGQAEVRNYNGARLPGEAPVSMENEHSLLTLSRGETRNWIVNNTVTWDKKFGDHSLRILAGQEAQRNKGLNIGATARDVPYTRTGDLYLALSATPANNTVSNTGSLFTVSSYFGRVNYSYQNKYLLNATLRADGSSKFTLGQQWAYLPSVGVGWVLTEEDFMKDQKIFNSLKLKGSWGKIGNSNVPLNLPFLLVDNDPRYTTFFGGSPNTGATITSTQPPLIFWEYVIGTDIGLEASLLDNKLYFEADWYNKKTTDAIFPAPILSSVGTSTSSVTANQADIQNRGVELTATWKDNVGKDWSYSISGNVGFNQNKVLNVTTGLNPLYAGGGAADGQLTTRTIQGEAIGEFYGYQVIGIFQNDAQVNSTPHRSATKPGDFIFADNNKDGVIDENDKVVLGNPNPKVTYGLNTGVAYKNFDLAIDVQGVAGVELYNGTKGVRFGNENYTEDFYNHRWHGEGTSNTDPSAALNGNNIQPSTWYVEKGDYLRIRNIQLGYTLPVAMLSRWKMKQLRVYVNAQNPFNFFKYSGFSPEVGGAPTTAGVDINVYPLYATYNFGVNISF